MRVDAVAASWCSAGRGQGGVMGVGGGSQAYLWPSGTGCWCACDMMIDWVTSRPREVRPLSLIGPSAAPVAGRGRDLTADWQELAAIGDLHRDDG